MRTSKGLIEYALIGGNWDWRTVAEISEIELQQFLNEHVALGCQPIEALEVTPLPAVRPRSCGYEEAHFSESRAESWLSAKSEVLERRFLVDT